MRRLGFYGIATPDGDLYEDEVCVWGGDEHGKRHAASVRDHLNDEIAEDATVKYRVVPLFWESDDAWQPIETAPRDGTRFLAFSPFGSQRMDIVSWNDEADSWADFSGAWWPGGDLTHWQPLPAPPKEKES